MKSPKVSIESRESKSAQFPYQSINVLTGETVGWYASYDLGIIDAHQRDIPVSVHYRSVRKAKR